MRNRKDVDELSAIRAHAIAAANRNGSTGELSDMENNADSHAAGPESPFPFLEVMLRKAKDSPFVVIGIMVSIAAIIVGATMSLAVGFGIFLFNMNGTMHELKQQGATTITELAAIKKQQTEDGNVMRAYEAANGKRTEFMVGLMTPESQKAMNDYDQSHPLPRMPQSDKDN